MDRRIPVSQTSSARSAPASRSSRVVGTTTTAIPARRLSRRSPARRDWRSTARTRTGGWSSSRTAGALPCAAIARLARVADVPDKVVYLITGGDRPKIEKALDRLRSHFAPEAIELTSALDVSGEEAVALCNAASLFGDARLVVVRDVDGRKETEGRRKGGWKAADAEAVAAYLVSPAPTTVLALVAEELKASSALWKTCAKAGEVLAYDIE